MTKLFFDNTNFNSKLPTKLEEATIELDKIIRESNKGVPRGFSSTKYNNCIDKVKRVDKGLKNVRADIIRANRNFNDMDSNIRRRHNNFDSNYRVGLDKPVILTK